MKTRHLILTTTTKNKQKIWVIHYSIQPKLEINGFAQTDPIM